MRAGTAIVAVLAGGAGSRLGGEKALAPLGGRALIEHPLAAAREAGLQSVVVAKRTSALPPLEVPVLHEPDAPRHPLVGVLAALRFAAAADAPAIVAVGCDMPFLSPALLAWLVSLPGSAVAHVEGHTRPLPARVEVAAGPALERALPQEPPLGRALLAAGARLLSERELIRWGDPGLLTASVNDAEQLRAAAARLGAPARRC